MEYEGWLSLATKTRINWRHFEAELQEKNDSLTKMLLVHIQNIYILKSFSVEQNIFLILINSGFSIKFLMGFYKILKFGNIFSLFLVLKFGPWTERIDYIEKQLHRNVLCSNLCTFQKQVILLLFQNETGSNIFNISPS